MAGYKRQQSYFDEDVILAEHTNDEYNQIQAAFHQTTGHKHDGTEGEGAALQLLQDGDGDTKIILDETPDNDKVSVYAAGNKVLDVTASGLVISNRFIVSYNATNDTLDIGVI